MFPSWWHSPEKMTFVFELARGIGIAAGIVTAICASVGYFSKNQADALKALRDADRHLTADQRRIFLDSLKRHSAIEVRLTCTVGNTESCAFAREFLDLFREAGWPIVGNGVTGVEAEGTMKGINLLVHNDSDASTAPKLAVLTGLFKSIDIVTQRSDSKHLPPNMIEVFIGPKP